MSGGQFSIRVEARFESAHFLRSYHGVAEPLHGHSYRVEAELFRAEGTLDDEAIAVDFIAAERELARLAKTFDYGCINDIEPFMEINPSAENLARWFHDELSQALQTEGARVREIVLWEGPLHSVRFVPESNQA
ncbi:MAG TPA: 6-carboxytetrahydropterin synthase [Thermoanaerobaculia bacterium]|nr:6-carboxytetrahydropterin synthase [Thermoanaerobaculia bacterium]